MGRAGQESAGAGKAVEVSKVEILLAVVVIAIMIVSGVGSALFVDRNPSFQFYQVFLVSLISLVFILMVLPAVLWILFFTRKDRLDYGDRNHYIEVDFSSPLNRGVLEYLKTRQGSKRAKLESASPASVKNPLAKTSTYPETGVRLWGELAASLPVDCRWIVCGVPALVHPQTGILFGVALGMLYCLRLTDADQASALRAGARTEHGRINLASQFGPDWVFGNWAPEELKWCRAEYEALGQAKGESR